MDSFLDMCRDWLRGGAGQMVADDAHEVTPVEGRTMSTDTSELSERGMCLRRPLAVALQGGGVYGAFAWGVLDRLFEEDGFEPAAFSGASAGAINAVVAAFGLLEGGPAGAREALRILWTRLGEMAPFSPLNLPGVSLPFNFLTQLVSPYEFNPFNVNPLRELLSDIVDFDRLRTESQRQLFVSATSVATGRARIFREHEISVDVLMASACLPAIHQAVTLDGEPYWDGGLSANPPLLPLVLDTSCRSLLLVKLTPDAEPEPHGAADISARFKRIMFNASAIRDLDAIAHMKDLLRGPGLLSAEHRRVRDLAIGAVSIDPAFFAEHGNSPLHPDPALIRRLHEAGRATADRLVPSLAAHQVA